MANNNNSNDLSANFYMNNVSQPSNGTSFAPTADTHAVPAMVWPTENANHLHHSESLVSVGGQTPTPFQDLLVEAMAERSGSPPNMNIQGLVSEDGSDLHDPHPAAGSRNNICRRNIDLNQPATDSDDSSDPIVISSGMAGYVVGEDGGEGRRFSCKRKSPEAASFLRESSRSVGQTSRLVSAVSDDHHQQQQQQQEDNDVNDENTHVSDNNAVIPQRQQMEARQVVLGLAAQEHAIRASNRANSSVAQWYQGVDNNNNNAVQAALTFPGEHAPGAFYPPSQLPSFNWNIATHDMNHVAPFPRLVRRVNREPWITHGRYRHPDQMVPPQPNLSSRLVPHVNREAWATFDPYRRPNQTVPAQGNFQPNVAPQYGHVFPDGAIDSHSIQHLGFSVNARMTSTGMSGQFVSTTQQSFVPPAIMEMHPLIQAQREIATLAASQMTSSTLFHEVRDTLALIRNVMVSNQSAVLYGEHEELQEDDDDDDEYNEHEAMHHDVDYMSFEEVEERNGSASSGLSDGPIQANLNHYRYDSTAEASSSSTNDTCCICQEEYADGEHVSTLHCGHCYHYECIRQWLLRKNNCPVCKRIAIPV